VATGEGYTGVQKMYHTEIWPYAWTLLVELQNQITGINILSKDKSLQTIFYSYHVAVCFGILLVDCLFGGL
jgi:hypothetical protein